MYTRCRDLYRNTADYIDKAVKLGGWIRTLRDNKRLAFVELYDGSFFKSVQVVMDSEMPGYEDAVKLGVGSCITVNGTVTKSPGERQPFEIKADSIILEGDSPKDYPLQKKRHSFEFLRTVAHLRPRTNTFAAVFRLRSLAAHAIHEFFQSRGFVYVHTPILTGSDCEGTSELFGVSTLPLVDVPKNKDGSVDYAKDFFNKPAFLTGSGQLAVEPFIMGFRDVYTFGPTFRSEHSNTTTHAAEFWMIEPEMAFADLDNYLLVAEDMLKYIIKYLFERAQEEMEFFNERIDKGLLSRLQKVVEAKFGRLSYTEAIEILKKADHKFDNQVEWGIDLFTEHERYLCEQVYKGPLYLTDYPREIKSHYMRLNEDEKTVAAADLLVPGVGELIGGSQREERQSVLEDNMRRKGLDPHDYDWYLDIRRYGGVKHTGFGLGFERCLMYLTGMTNIRDVIPYPRAMGQMAF